jgi:putative CocE/NonD family hydrolase
MKNYRACARRCAALLALSLMSVLSAAEVGPGYDIEMSRMIPTRDGVQLEAWITKPSQVTGKLPTVLTLTQYDIDGGRHKDLAGSYARHGYAFVQAYVRGRGRSGGDKSDNTGPTVGRDGYDLVEWIAAQPWSDGKVVMFGGSFVGMTQWRTAAQHPPHLASIAPYVAIYPGWDIPNTNGIPQAWSAVIMGYVSGRSLNSGFIANRSYWSGKMLEHYAKYGSFRDLDAAIGIAADDWWMIDARGQKMSFMDMWLDHVGDEAWNLAAEPKPQDYAAMAFPVLSVTGFYDDDQAGALRYYRGHMAHAPAAATSRHYLVIGPWDHFGSQAPEKVIDGLRIDDAAVLDMEQLHLQWYDFALGRGPLPALLKDKVSYFMPGADEWRYASSLEAASSGGELNFFLEDRRGTPESVFRSGRLVTTAPGAEPPAVIISDPRELPELEVAKFADSEDATSQFRGFQRRAISFHTEPFATRIEVAGHMRLRLLCAADAPDFDLWAQVLMVLPDGSTVRLGEDIRRARFRNSQFKAELLNPSQVAEIPFEFNWMARSIPAGARLRLTIAPLNSPNFQKNFNTGGRLGYEKIDDARVATIKIFHDAKRASRLVLPLAERSRGGAQP